MTEVVYPGPLVAVVLPDGTVCEKDKPVSVDDATAKNLIRQGFAAPKSEKGNK